MDKVGDFRYYMCGRCKNKHIWVKWSVWIEKHFNKYHPKEQIKIFRIYKNAKIYK